LQTLLQRKVDLVTKNALHPRIYAQVLKEAQPLWKTTVFILNILLT